MDEELKKRLLDYMDTLDSAVREGGDFVLEQAPLVVQEFITYTRATQSGYLLLAVAIFAVQFPVIKRIRKWILTGDGYMKEADASIVSCIGYPLTSAVALVMFAANFNAFVMAWF